MLKRDIFDEQLSRYIDTPVVKVITGVRRSGKSYLLKLLNNHLIESGVNKEQIITIDLESAKFRNCRNYEDLYDYVKSCLVEKRVYILIDEVQEVKEWEKAVRSFLVDFNCDVYLTGSNAHLLSSELATFLAGRYVELNLYTLSFNEYMNFYDYDTDYEAFYEYLKYGGFPGLFHMPKDDDIRIQYIKDIYNSVILKDVIQRNKIRDAELLERIIIYLMDNIGQVFSATRISNYLKNQGRKASIESIYSYIRALESAFILYPAKRYDVKGKKILERMEKYFITDLGIRYSLLGYKQNDISQLLENVVFLELKRRGYKVYVGKEGDYEIDFIAEKSGEKIYIQVTYLLASDEVIELEFRPLMNVKDNYKKLVLSMDQMTIADHEGIKWMHVIDFLRNE